MKFIDYLVQDVPDEKQTKKIADKLFFVITCGIFIVETLIMILLDLKSDALSFYVIFFDSAILTAIIAPLIYYFFLNPLLINISKRSISQQNMIKINEQLNLESQRLFKVLDGLPASVHLLDRNHKISFANRYFSENFGDIKEQTCYKLLQGKDAPCDVCKTLDIFTDRKSEEHEIKRSNGHIYNIYNYPFIDTDGKELVLQLGIDISKRKKAEIELKRRERQLNLVVNSMSDTLCTMSVDERIMEFFGKGLLELGLDTDKFIGKKVSKLFKPEKVTEFKQAFQQVLNGENTLFNWETELPSGNLYFQNVLSPVFDENGKVISVTGIARNVTRQKMLENKLIETEKLNTVVRMVAMISHEFRNSLTSVRMILELLGESPDIRPDNIKSLSVALKSVAGMENIVKQLLDYSRPSQISVSPSYISDIIDDSIDLITPQLNQHKIVLSKSYASNTPLLMVDVLKLKESFVNLLLNAIQAINENNGGSSKKEIYISTHRSTLLNPLWNMAVYEQKGQDDDRKVLWEEKFDNTLAAGTDTLVISFLDSGPGIKAENLVHVFDSFFTTRKEGSGLGLAIVKRIVSDHDGVVTIISTQDQGTSVNIYLKA